MTIRRVLTVAMAAATTLAAGAVEVTDSLNYDVRLGYNIGGTSPVGMPATIRKLNSYKLSPNVSLGFDVQKDLRGRWGVMAGLHLENKGMETDATVKNYHMSIDQDGASLEGYFTGHNVTKVEEWLITVPVMATCRVGGNVILKLGPYLSYVLTRKFEGNVYDGYLRHNTPTGAKISFGHEEGERGTFDFSDDMRRWQFGVDFGADWYFCRRWGVYADIAWGLTGVHKSSFKTIEQRLYPIYGTFGVAYKLK